MTPENDPAVMQRAATMLIEQHGFTGIHAKVMREYAAVHAQSVGQLARLADTYACLQVSTMHMFWHDMSRLMRAEAHGWRLVMRPDTCGWEDAIGVSAECIRRRARIERKQQRRFAERVAQVMRQKMEAQ